MEAKKYKLRTDLTMVHNDTTLYRIEALKDFRYVKKGDLGGWIEKEDNLSQRGNCWVFDDACVYDNAKIYGNARIGGNALVCDNAEVWGDSNVYDYATMCNNAEVYGQAIVHGRVTVDGSVKIMGDAELKCNTDYYVGKNTWSSGRFFTYTRSNKMWKVGCFYGTSKELIEKAYKDSKLSGEEYERVVKYAEEMYKNLEKHNKHT